MFYKMNAALRKTLYFLNQKYHLNPYIKRYATVSVFTYHPNDNKALYNPEFGNSPSSYFGLLKGRCVYRLLCSENKIKNIPENAIKNDIKTFIKERHEKLKDTEQKIKIKGTVILQDIKETKNKVKEKVEEVIERENVYTIPNFLCISRIMLSPYLGLLIVQANFELALALLGIAAFTDLLDGWIARTWKSQSSKMGSFLDPMADKVLIASLFLSLTYADLIPVLLTSMIIARDVILVIAGFVIRYNSLPPPKTLSRYFDVTHATAQLAPTFISKVNTGIQLLLVGSTLAAPVFHYVGHPLLEGLWYVTGVSTIAAAVSYVISKDTYRILRNKNTK